MSNIPFTAISGSLTPVQQQTNESLRARRLQAQKNVHHAEDVDELDETAVGSVRDQAQHRNRQDQDQAGDDREPHEQVDIQSLDAPAPVSPAAPAAPSSAHLDISA